MYSSSKLIILVTFVVWWLEVRGGLSCKVADLNTMFFSYSKMQE